MYRRPKFLEVLLDIRQEMARQADYDVDLFVELSRSGKASTSGSEFSLTETEGDKRSSNKDQAEKRGRKKAQRS